MANTTIIEMSNVPTNDNVYRQDMARHAKAGMRYGYKLHPDANRRTPMPIAMLSALGYLDACRVLLYEPDYPGGGQNAPHRWWIERQRRQNEAIRPTNGAHV